MSTAAQPADRYYVKIRAEAPQGPLTWADVAQMALSGHLRPADLITTNGTAWRRVGDMGGLTFAQQAEEATAKPNAFMARPDTSLSDEQMAEQMSEQAVQALGLRNASNPK